MSTQNTYNGELEKYLAGELTPQERFQLEKKALDDPFLWDTIEGYNTVPGDYKASLDRLRKKIADQKKERSKIIPLRWISVAAASLALLATAYFFIDSNEASLESETMVAAEEDIAETMDDESIAIDDFTETIEESSPIEKEKASEPSVSKKESRKKTPVVVENQAKATTLDADKSIASKEKETPQTTLKTESVQEEGAVSLEDEDRSSDLKNDFVVAKKEKTAEADRGLKTRGSLKNKVATEGNSASQSNDLNSTKLKSALRPASPEEIEELAADAIEFKPELFHTESLRRYLRNEGWWKSYESRLPAYSQIKIALKDNVPSVEFIKDSTFPEEIKNTLVPLIKTFYKKQGKALPAINEYILILKSK